MHYFVENNIKLSPVVIFAYNRPKHLKKLLNSLQDNELSNETDVVIFVDCAANPLHKKETKEVERVANLNWKFNSLKIMAREENYGLRRNILNGINYMFENEDKLIVLEDDLVLSKHFLYFMNYFLDKYKNTEKVWHIGGWNFPNDESDFDSTYFSTLMYCWGWGTWKNRWEKHNQEKYYEFFNFTKKQKYDFDLKNSYNLSSQLYANKSKKIDTWAIFWYQTIFKNNGLCLYPLKSLVDNIGADGSGENSGVDSSLRNIINHKLPLKYPESLVVDEEVMKQKSIFYKSRNMLSKKIIRKIKKLLN